MRIRNSWIPLLALNLGAGLVAAGWIMGRPVVSGIGFLIVLVATAILTTT